MLAELGLEPLVLEAKEGLALTNGTSFMSAFACLAVGAARELADLADLLTAMASEALLGNRGHFNAFLFDEAKPHPGMVTSARNIRALLADSRLALDSEELFSGGMDGAGFLELDAPGAGQVLDPLRARTSPGVLRDVLDWVRAVGRRSRSTPPTTTRCSTSAASASRAAATSTAATSGRRWTR